MCWEDGENFFQSSGWRKILLFFFAIQDKRQAIILAMSYIKYLQVFDSKSDLEYLSSLYYLNYFKD